MSRRPFVAQLHKTPGEMRFQGVVIDDRTGDHMHEVFARETKGLVEILTFPKGTAAMMGEKSFFPPAVFYLHGDNIILAGSSPQKPEIIATQFEESIYRGHRYLALCPGQRPAREGGEAKIINPRYRFG